MMCVNSLRTIFVNANQKVGKVRKRECRARQITQRGQLDAGEVATSARTGRPNFPIRFKRRLAAESHKQEALVAKFSLRDGLSANKKALQGLHCFLQKTYSLPRTGSHYGLC